MRKIIPFYEQINENIRIFNSMGLIYPSHLHPQLELIYVLEPELKMTINNDKRLFKKGDFIILFPNTIHSYDPVSSKGPKLGRILIIICELSLTGDYMNKLINYHAKDSFILKENLHENVGFAMEALLKEKDQGKNTLVCSAFIQLILARTLVNLELIKNQEGDYNDLIYQLVNFISQNFRQHLSLENIANQLGVSKYYLSRIFTKRLNTNFNDYINGVRLNYATMLMGTTDYSITQIWNDSGFNSQRTFNRVFLESYQMTPREYRNKDKENIRKEMV